MKRARLAPAEAVPPLDRAVPLWPGRTVRIDGTTTFVRDTPATGPDAEPALYVHGLGGSSTNWTDLAYLLAHRLDGQAIDLPGFGRSDPAPRYTLGALAARVIRWIEHSERGPVHLFGNSLGGAVTVRVAALRPDLIRTLTLISPAMPFLDPRRSETGRLVPLLMVPQVQRIAARWMSTMDPVEVARMSIQTCFADPDRCRAERMAEAVEEARRRVGLPWHADAYVRSLRGLVGSFVRAYLPGSGSLWRIAATVPVPTLVLAGRQDRLVDIRVAPQVARAIPDSRLLIMDNVGHVAQMEVPAVVARAVTALLDDEDVRSRPSVGGWLDAAAPADPPEALIRSPGI